MDEIDWQKLNEAFASVVRLEGQTRYEFIEKLDDEDLRIEVAALVEAADHAGREGFLKADAFAAVTQILASDQSEEVPSIGRYRLVRELGRGGMGTVFLAERTDFCQRVALKLIKRGMDTDQIIRRFQRERQVLASLNHPHIAHLFDGGMTAQNTPFFVMEYVEGLPISDFCDRQKLKIEERLRLFCKLCAAVAYAHDNLIIHRDIKPSNILVTNDGEPKLLDFGISKLLAADTSDTTIEQTTGIRLMTPDYASPEQICGGPITVRSDVYSLGVLLYELLCGLRPFELTSIPVPEIIRILSEHEPTAPSIVVSKVKKPANKITNDTVSPRIIAALRQEHPAKLQRRLRGDLDNIVLKALRREPEQRYESVDQLSADIHRHLTGTPVTARGSNIRYRSARFLKRNRTPVAFATLLVLFIVVVSASWTYFFWTSHTEPRVEAIRTSRLDRRTIVVLPFEATAPDDEPLAFDLTANLIARLGRLQELEVRTARGLPANGKDAITAGKQLGVETVLETKLERTNERVLITHRLLKTTDNEVLWSDSINESLTTIANAQNEVAEQVAAVLLGQLTIEQRKKVKKRYTDSPEAYKLYLQGKHLVNLQNEKSLHKSIQYFNRAIELDPGYALAHAGIADAYMGLSGVYLTPREAFPRAKAAAIKALELDPELAEAHVVLALILEIYEWNWAAASKEFALAIELNPNYPSARHWYGRHLALTARKAESIEQFKRARELDPLAPYIALDSSFPHFFDRQPDRALEQINEAIKLDNNFWFAYWIRGWVKQDKGDIVGAIADYKKAQSIEDSTTIQSFLAHAYAVSGQRGQARSILKYLIETKERGNANAPLIAAIYVGLADSEQAFKWLETGYSERSEWMVWLKYDHRFDELKKYQSFQNLLLRIGLPDAPSH